MAGVGPGGAVPELLGSLTSQQQQRTSARVSNKQLRLDPPTSQDKRDAESDAQIKLEDSVKCPLVKQRMPKAIWSPEEKSLFFEALNEYGKDFDAIRAHICAKMKKKGMPDANLKTKTQVSHFYYRTWHKLAKYVRYGENVKKVAQELYSLINYGELRKKLVSVNEKVCSRLSEMVLSGSIVVRARGKNLRVRTPMCRALRKLNLISERSCGMRVCSLSQVHLRARDMSSWSRVQASAHNPRLVATVPLRASLATFVTALQNRWRGNVFSKRLQTDCSELADCDQLNCEVADQKCQSGDDNENHLNVVTDSVVFQENRLPKRPVLHLGPRLTANIQLPSLSPNESLSTQNICFSSYLQRMAKRDLDIGPKIRTPKRQRKDSNTEKDSDAKKQKIEDSSEVKLMNIDETAVDGIELMANYRNVIENDEKEKKTMDFDVEANPEITKNIKDLLEKDKDIFSELEDDEKFIKSDTDNESDQGKGDKSKKVRRFKNLKVKFRLKPKKLGGSEYTLVKDNIDFVKCAQDDKIGELTPKSEEKTTEPTSSEENNLKSDDKVIEISKPPLEDKLQVLLTKIDDKILETSKLIDDKAYEITKTDEVKSDIDVEFALRQIRKGWCAADAGNLTIGDLYLMFGARSKLELDYWWAEPTPPLPQSAIKSQKQSDSDKSDKDRCMEKKEKLEKTPDKTDSSVEETSDKRESDSELFSPKANFGQDSNDGLSGDERKLVEPLASPENKTSSNCSSAFKLASKLINNPNQPKANNNGFAIMSDRLKRLLALVGNPHVPSLANQSPSSCSCGHVCSSKDYRKQPPSSAIYTTSTNQCGVNVDSAIFRHPTPIAPKGDPDANIRFPSPGGLVRRRGRGRGGGVVVQRLLPLLPKLPPPSNLIPVKIVPNSRKGPPKILPKPTPASCNDLSFFYVLSESNGQFYFHDGDRKVPLTDASDMESSSLEADEVELKNGSALCESKLESVEIAPTTSSSVNETNKSNVPDVNNINTESISLSPSRLLRDTEWLEGATPDFSLSSLLGQLEERTQHDMQVDSQLQSLMAESSVDYVAKFADLAAEVTDSTGSLAEDLR